MDKQRSCEHPEVASRFCPECGAPMWIEKIVKLEYSEYWSGCNHDGKVLTFYGDYESEYAGVDAGKLLEDLSLTDARDHFRKLVRDKLKVDIPLKSIDLYYGEAGND